MMTPEQEALLNMAREAAKMAYAPYSNFRVGAAVLTDKGIFTGANIENSSTNLGTCAERVALAHARMHEASSIIGVAVCCLDSIPDEGGEVPLEGIMPCGGCRQWLAELAANAWLVTDGVDRVFTVAELLPDPFVLNR